MPLAGNLRQVDLADVLRVVESGQRSGVLVVTHANLQANIYFSGGRWLGAERVGSVQVLAQQLARAGIIRPEDFEGVFGVTYAQVGAVPDAEAARGLIAARLLTQEQLRGFAVNDATSLLTVMLTWPDGDFIFEEGVTLPPGRIALPLSVGPLVAQALRLARPGGADPAREAPSLSLESTVDFADVDPMSGVAVEVTRDQWRLLTAVDGQTPLWAIAENLQAPDGLVLRLANDLLAAGLVVPSRDPAAARPNA
jgi:hypothetical protein